MLNAKMNAQFVGKNVCVIPQNTTKNIKISWIFKFLIWCR